jgi:hypothetical protein
MLIKWDDNYILKANDFRMKPPEKRTNIKAAGAFRIETEYDIAEGFFSFKVSNLFNKDSSWILDPSASLIHIQDQFGLREVYSRLIRKELLNLHLKSNESIDAIINSRTKYLLAEFEKEARRFDLESLNGDNKEYELKWQKYIVEKLKELKDYSFNGEKFVNF